MIPGQAVFSTPEDAEIFRKANEEMTKDPAKWEGYGWEGVIPEDHQ